MNDIDYKHGPRQSGRTQRMLEAAVDAIVLGQPYVQIVGRQFTQLRGDLIPRTLKLLDEQYMDYQQIRPCEYICEESLLTFHTAKSIEEYNRGRPQSHFDCQFWDHFALEENYL